MIFVFNEFIWTILLSHPGGSSRSDFTENISAAVSRFIQTNCSSLIGTSVELLEEGE